MSIQKKVRFLHISDPHFSKNGTALGDQDLKNPLNSVMPRTREDTFERTIGELAKLREDEMISSVLLTGDFDNRGPSGGMAALRDMISRTFAGALPPIIAIPGNHDVLRGSEPSSPERYKTFVDSWRSSGLNVKTPFLDGIDKFSEISSNWERHCSINSEANREHIIIPINSCNWSQSKLQIRKDFNSAFWESVKKTVGSGDTIKEAEFDKELQIELEKYNAVDAALISDNQFNALREIIGHAEKKVSKDAIKIALIHHHLLPVNSNEEHKIYGDIINLGKLRQFLRQHGFHILLHGHKHTNAVYIDHIYEENTTNLNAHELLVISGGTIASDGKAACRLVDLEGLPHAPVCKISNVSLIPPGAKLSPSTITHFAERSLWKSSTIKTPYLVTGTGIDEVYERACQIFDGRKVLDRPLICHIEFDNADAPYAPVPPPMRYPKQGENANGESDDLVQWFKETVKWWQLPISKIEARIPYIHGTRLFRFGGAIDQIERISKLLHKSRGTSKAVAVLVDPIRDFKDDPSKHVERFASFCLVQFKIHGDVLECIAYYRAQEFRKWWPINVAELRKLQIEVGKKLQPGVTIGGITTIAGDARIEDNVSPTQVAVPLIDQWLDSYPHKIAAMAHAVLWPKHAGASKPNYQDDWRRCLNDILVPTNSYTSEGIPVAIEGLDHLRMFLVEFGDEGNGLHADLIAQVQDLLDANGVFSRSEKNETTFDLWSKQVNRHVAAILKHSDDINRQSLIEE